MGIAIGILLVVSAIVGRLMLGKGEKAIEPASRPSIKGIFELLLEFIIGLADMVIGEEGRKFVPMFTAIFFFIWVHNMAGLLPGLAPATDNLNITLALGLFSFVAYNFYGIREHGIAYTKHFLGPLLALIPLMLPLELISNAVRPLTLGLRLYGNIMADHTVISVFNGLFDKFWFIPVPAIFYGLGVFVACMQAFVFTILSMIYVSMAIAHDH